MKCCAVRSWLLVLTAALALVGCTEERAVVVKTAADAFAAKSQGAIDAVTDLYLRHDLGQAPDDNSQIKAATKDFLDQAGKDATQLKLPNVIAVEFNWIGARERLLAANYPQAADLKKLYGDFAAAYAKLPEGSAFAARDVVCSAHLAALLTKRMADAAKKVNKTPVTFGKEITDSDTVIRKAAEAAAKSNKADDLEVAVRARAALVKEQAGANALVVQKLTDAAESGAALMTLLEGYDNVSLADLLRGVRSVLAVGVRLGEASDATEKRADDVLAKLNSKPDLANVLKLPLNSKLDSCQ